MSKIKNTFIKVSFIFITFFSFFTIGNAQDDLIKPFGKGEKNVFIYKGLVYNLKNKEDLKKINHILEKHPKSLIVFREAANRSLKNKNLTGISIGVTAGLGILSIASAYNGGGLELIGVGGLLLGASGIIGIAYVFKQHKTKMMFLNSFEIYYRMEVLDKQSPEVSLKFGSSSNGVGLVLQF